MVEPHLIIVHFTVGSMAVVSVNRSRSFPSLFNNWLSELVDCVFQILIADRWYFTTINDMLDWNSRPQFISMMFCVIVALLSYLINNLYYEQCWIVLYPNRMVFRNDKNAISAIRLIESADDVPFVLFGQQTSDYWLA